MIALPNLRPLSDFLLAGAAPGDMGRKHREAPARLPLESRGILFTGPALQPLMLPGSAWNTAADGLALRLDRAARWLWPVTTLLLSALAWLALFGAPAWLPAGDAWRENLATIQPLGAAWLLCMSPGMALVRCCSLRGAAGEWLLAAVASVGSSALLYLAGTATGWWSIEEVLAVSILVSMFGALAQPLVQAGRRRSGAFRHRDRVGLTQRLAAAGVRRTEAICRFRGTELTLSS